MLIITKKHLQIEHNYSKCSKVAKQNDYIHSVLKTAAIWHIKYQISHMVHYQDYI